MLKKSPKFALLAVILAYIALMLLIPRATFISDAIKAIAGILHSHEGIAALALKSAAFVLFAIPIVAVMVLQVAVTYFYARIRTSPWKTTLVFLLCTVCAAVLIVVMGRELAAAGKAKQSTQGIALLKIPISLFVALAASSIGCLVARRVKDKNLLLPVVMFAAYIDFWTVTRGPVASMLQHAPAIAHAVSAPIPTAGAGAFMPISMVGPGDFLFMALVFAAVDRLGMNARRNFWFIFAAMTLGMLAVVLDLLPYLPALIVLAVAVVAANWREFKLTRQEKISIKIVAIVLAASLPLIWSVLKRL